MTLMWAHVKYILLSSFLFNCRLMHDYVIPFNCRFDILRYNL